MNDVITYFLSCNCLVCGLIKERGRFFWSVLIPEFFTHSKLIGARYYEPGSESALDFVGHGTHTASTAAGSVVEGASYFGLANGTARGGVPSARIAVYCICNSLERCQADAILAAFDDAIADGVDIITASVAWEEALPFDQDVIAIGSFHAMSEGILVTQAAGNTGPQTKTSSVAPWVLTVAANSVDRQFITKLVLGDGTILTVCHPNSSLCFTFQDFVFRVLFVQN